MCKPNKSTGPQFCLYNLSSVWMDVCVCVYIALIMNLSLKSRSYIFIFFKNEVKSRLNGDLKKNFDSTGLSLRCPRYLLERNIFDVEVYDCYNFFMIFYII